MTIQRFAMAGKLSAPKPGKPKEVILLDSTSQDHQVEAGRSFRPAQQKLEPEKKHNRCQGPSKHRERRRNTLASSVPALLISHHCLPLAEPIWKPEDIEAWETQCYSPPNPTIMITTGKWKRWTESKQPKISALPHYTLPLLLNCSFRSHIIQLSSQHSLLSRHILIICLFILPNQNVNIMVLVCIYVSGSLNSA